MTPRIFFVCVLAALAFSSLAAQGREKAVHDMFVRAYRCEPLSLEVSGRCALASPPKNAWQAVVSVGKSTYAYPYFLLREKHGTGVDVVFFNEEGKGYYVVASEVSKTASGVTLAIERRGGGEDGMWKLREALTLSRPSPDGHLVVIVDGEETTAKLLFFSLQERPLQSVRLV